MVSTTRVTHATPAATYSHVCHRDGENTIAAQLAVGGTGYNTALGADVVLGGGWQHFLPKGAAAGSSRSDARDLVAERKAKGYGCGLRRPLGRAASIVPPSVVAGMPVLRATPRVVGSRNVWHVEKDGEWSHRVLWSADRRIALRVESARLDGSVRRVVTVEPAKPGSAGAPWADTAAYAQKEYDDFMD